LDSVWWAVVPSDIEYLVVIHRLSGGGEALARPSAIADALGVTVAAVSLKLRDLMGKGLVVVHPWRGARLTREGRRVLAVHAWKKGIVEHILARLGVPLDRISEVSGRISMAIPDDVAERICEGLKHPPSCPHGRRIPHPELGDVEDGDYCMG